jgi:hypothetical protein
VCACAVWFVWWVCLGSVLVWGHLPVSGVALPILLSGGGGGGEGRLDVVSGWPCWSVWLCLMRLGFLWFERVCVSDSGVLFDPTLEAVCSVLRLVGLAMYSTSSSEDIVRGHLRRREPSGRGS